jgi:hypothetical protein
MTSNLNILFHLISPRRRKETKGEVKGCVINCSIIHSQHHLLQAEYHTCDSEVWKTFLTSTCCVLLLSVYKVKVHRVISNFYCKPYLETK